jgi:hypothetical protein
MLYSYNQPPQQTACQYTRQKPTARSGLRFILDTSRLLDLFITHIWLLSCLCRRPIATDNPILGALCFRGLSCV